MGYRPHIVEKYDVEYGDRIMVFHGNRTNLVTSYLH